MDNYFQLNVAGLTRQLPICPLNDNISIAGFVMFSDVELTIACATQLLEKSPDFDVIITAESKGIPLAYEMSKQSGKKYLLARKSIKLYMRNAIGVDVKSISTSQIQTLYMDINDMEFIKDKKVLIVDDVISTGESLRALEQLVNKGEGNIVGKCAVLAEGDAKDRTDIFFLEELPLIFNK